MTQTFKQIIRKDNVKVAGSCRIDLAGNAIHSPAQSPAQPDQPQPQVKIVEAGQSAMVLEFTCPCGCKSYIQCEYE